MNTRIPEEQDLPWWLAQELPCALCSQWLALHSELRCTSCDRVLCRACVLVVQGTAGGRCSECGAAGDGGV